MKHKTIKKHQDFVTGPSDPFVRAEYFVIKIKPVSGEDGARYGVVAPKKFFHHAVQRNRAKRLLRDWLAFNEDLMQDCFDYIFIANTDILTANRENGRQEMKDALMKVAASGYKNEE